MSESHVTRIAILGSTGSIGQSALSVVDTHGDRLEVVGLAAGENAERLAEQIARYRPRIVSLATASAADVLRGLSRGSNDVVFGGIGREGLVAVATHPDVDIVLCASSGTDGLEATLAAIECGKTIALARVDVAHAALDTALEVGKLDGQQKRLPARVVALSHYDPKKTRPQS